MVALDAAHTPSQRRALIGVGLLFVIELAVIGTLFKHGISFKCLDHWPVQACQGASGSLVALYCVMGAGLLFWMLRPAELRALTAHAGARIWPLAVNGVGVLLALVPVLFLKPGAGTSVILPAFGFWTTGMILMLAGVMLYAAPTPLWRRFIAQNGLSLVPILGFSAIAPYLAALIRPIWHLDTVAAATFHAVAWTLKVLGYDLEVYAKEKVIGADGFYIDVAPQCSGVEGLALVTVFVSIYLSMFRKDLRFPRAFWLFPIGLAASALFNVVRIAVLVAIGVEGNPELAVGGFHSHAGWLMFTLVALGVIALAQTVPALQKNSTSSAGYAAGNVAPLPLLQDPIVAKILPFAIFMLSAMLASAFSQNPSLVYPLRVLLMAGVLVVFWKIYIRLSWRIDPVALAAGIAIGLMWVLIPVEPSDGPAPYGTLTGMLLIGWFILRGLGTIVLVPIIEELFFRDYLESRLRLGTGKGWIILAAVTTALLFAALHDRWVEAFIAGLVFSWVIQRRGTVVDAIVAHAAANALVYSVALATGNLDII